MAGKRSPGAAIRRRIGRGNDVELHSLVRYSHIFASAVREILEIKLLREVEGDGLSLPQFHLLKLIALNGSHQIGQIADFLGVSPPAATKNIDKLERLGLVVRTPCEGDRRATLLSSSPKGKALVTKYETLKEKRLQAVFDSFETDELAQLTYLLERFSIALLCADDDHEGLCLRCSAYFDERCPIQHIHGGCPYQKAVRGRHEAQLVAEGR